MYNEYYDLEEKVADMDYGPERVAAAEELVRKADLMNDEIYSYYARLELVDSTTHSGQEEKSFAPFAWCVEFVRNNPEEDIDLYLLTWQHKWIVSSALDFPQIPLERIYQLLDSYEEFVQREGFSKSSVHYMRLSVADHLGDTESMQKYYTLWKFGKRDSMSDCIACEASEEIDYFITLGQQEKAAALAEKAINGKTCHTVPHTIYGKMLLPLLELGQHEKAAEYLKRGKQMISSHPDVIDAKADVLKYLSVTDLEAAADWYAKHLPMVESQKSACNHFDYHSAAALFFGRLKQKAKAEEISLQLPQSSHGWQENGRYSISQRFDYHLAEARALAKSFDDRNGNREDWIGFADILKKNLEWIDYQG